MICLRGNHDQMLLDFLDDPKAAGPRWFRHGGLQTLGSYGLPGVAVTAPDQLWLDLRDRLREAMGQETETWLRGLPLSWQSGNVFVCHAGADPGCPVANQTAHTLLWGHPAFETTPRTDGELGRAWPYHHGACAPASGTDPGGYRRLCHRTPDRGTSGIRQSSVSCLQRSLRSGRSALIPEDTAHVVWKPVIF